MAAFLDTCTVIDILREDKPHYRKRLEEAVGRGEEIVISSFVLHELVFGAMVSARPEAELALVDGFVERARVEPWTAEDGIAAARVRADLRATGSQIGAVDSLIAGQALNRGWNVVTSNTKDFIRIPGLTVVDWSDPAGPLQMNRTEAIAEVMRRLKDEGLAEVMRRLKEDK